MILFKSFNRGTNLAACSAYSSRVFKPLQQVEYKCILEVLERPFDQRVRITTPSALYIKEHYKAGSRSFSDLASAYKNLSASEKEKYENKAREVNETVKQRASQYMDKIANGSDTLKSVEEIIRTHQKLLRYRKHIENDPEAISTLFKDSTSTAIDLPLKSFKPRYFGAPDRKAYERLKDLIDFRGTFMPLPPLQSPYNAFMRSLAKRERNAVRKDVDQFEGATMEEEGADSNFVQLAKSAARQYQNLRPEDKDKLKEMVSKDRMRYVNELKRLISQ